MVRIRVRRGAVSGRGGNVFLSVQPHQRHSITDICICICPVWNSAGMLTKPFLLQASRQFDQEGRKKFFTLDMNNILLEWVGQFLNHRQPNTSSHSSSLSVFLTHFQQISLATSPAVLKCFVFPASLIVCVNDMLLISIPLSCAINFMFTLPSFCATTLYSSPSITSISHLCFILSVCIPPCLSPLP